MAQVLHDGTIRHEDNCLSDLGHTTPASVASRLTDEQIESIAESLEHDAENLYGDNTRSFMDDENNAAAVLRDYVRMRKLAVKLIEELKEAKQLRCGECWFTVNMGKCPHSLDNECVARRWHNLLEAAEKGEVK